MIRVHADILEPSLGWTVFPCFDKKLLYVQLCDNILNIYEVIIKGGEV